MKTWTVWMLVVLAGCVAVTGGCRQGGRDSSILSLRELAQTDLELHWTIRVDLNEDADEQIQSLYYEPDRVYAVTSENRLLGLDAFSGQYLWSADLGNQDIRPTDITQLGRAVFICVLDKLYAFNAADGRQVRAMDLSYAPTTAPVISGEYAYYGTNSGWFVADGLFDKGANWDRLTYAAIMSAPTFDASRVYFANVAGDVFASTASKRVIQWEHHLGAAVVGDLKRTGDGLVLVPCRDYVLYALNPSTGQVAWMNTTGDPLEKSPHVRDGRVYIVKKGNTLLSIDEKNGKTVWQAENIVDIIAASPQTVFARATSGNVVALSREDGAVKMTLATEDLSLAAVNGLDGQLFVASPDGEISAVREKSVTYNDPVMAPAKAAAAQ